MLDTCSIHFSGVYVCSFVYPLCCTRVCTAHSVVQCECTRHGEVQHYEEWIKLQISLLAETVGCVPSLRRVV